MLIRFGYKTSELGIINMSKTLIIGANGQIARLLLPKLVARGESCVAMVRDASQLSDLKDDKIEIVEGDLEHDFSHAYEGCTKVIFAAGSGGKTGFDKTLLVDLWGARNAIENAKRFNIDLFVMVSARGASDPDKGPAAIKPYCVAKYFADQYLIQSGVEYCILRPGRLLDEAPCHGFTKQRPDDKEQQVISREDTADAIAFALNDERFIGKTIELYQGESSLEQLANTI